MKVVGFELMTNCHYSFADFTLSGSEFQRVGAATENDVDRIVVLNLGTM